MPGQRQNIVPGPNLKPRRHPPLPALAEMLERVGLDALDYIEDDMDALLPSLGLGRLGRGSR